mmetsp:Transcript_131793/g.421876  ORF Transcript_131793/g.421876 Transcript_131793/m.421876 type:complete len:465 (+) Transcript_131793:102-1496(+)
MDKVLLSRSTGGLFDPWKEQPRPGAPLAGRISVICPTTDERTLFHAQLYSCFVEQRWPDKELVVIDTGACPSPFLAKMALQDTRLVYRHYRTMATSWPVGLKRNIAVHLASGQVVAHFDDDDLYAPCYLERMVAALAGADAVTLSSWLVCDPLAGVSGRVNPGQDGYRESWVLGYGFSHMYLRKACLASPFPHEHFAEDYKFMLALQRALGSRGVYTHCDEEGIVLHMQQGTNLSTSHACDELQLSQLRRMPIAELSTFGAVADVLSKGAAAAQSSFLSFGEAFRMYLRPSPHRNVEDLMAALQAVGVAAACPAPLSSGLWENFGFGADACAVVSCDIWRGGVHCVEPGRAFGEAPRFAADVPLPEDVPRTALPEWLALMHAARALLRRCPAGLGPERRCRGWLRLRVRALSHLALAGLAAQFARHFPGVRLEVDFGPAEVLEDPCRAQRELMVKLLTEQGLRT